jgi:hypothetical protein
MRERCALSVVNMRSISKATQLLVPLSIGQGARTATATANLGENIGENAVSCVATHLSGNVRSTYTTEMVTSLTTPQII